MARGPRPRRGRDGHRRRWHVRRRAQALVEPANLPELKERGPETGPSSRLWKTEGRPSGGNADGYQPVPKQRGYTLAGCGLNRVSFAAIGPCLPVESRLDSRVV